MIAVSPDSSVPPPARRRGGKRLEQSLQEPLSRRVWFNCCRLRMCGSNLPEGVVLVNHHMHKRLVSSSLLHSLRHTLLGSICCMQTYFYLDEVSRHYQSYWQRSATRKMTDKYLYTTIAHKRKRIKKIPTYLLKILTCSII